MNKEVQNKIITISVLICGIIVILAFTACCVALAVKFIFWLF